MIDNQKIKGNSSVIAPSADFSDVSVSENLEELSVNLSPEKIIKSKKRVKQFGEVFTPEHIVKQMCDICEPVISRIDSKIFEPTCGNGNFLVEILHRKLKSVQTIYYKKTHRKIPKTAEEQSIYEFLIISAVSNIYAVDIQYDNVCEARRRMQDIVMDFVKNQKSSIHFLNALESVLKNNIILGNTLTQKNKLYFYDYKPDYDELMFSISRHSLKEIEAHYNKIRNSKMAELHKTLLFFNESPPKRAKKPPSKTTKKNKTTQTKLDI